VKAVAAVMISQDRMLVDNPLGCVEGILIILSKYFTFLDFFTCSPSTQMLMVQIP
jgi:hypothetical protein